MDKNLCKRVKESIIARMAPYEVEPNEKYKTGKPKRYYMGACYQKAFEYFTQVKPTGGVLVHGIYAPESFMSIKTGHAWVELPGNIIFDGVLQRFYRKEDYCREYKAEKMIEIDSVESAYLEVANNDYCYGPWYDEDKRMMDEAERMMALPNQVSPIEN